MFSSQLTFESVMGVTNHWTGLLDWNTGLDYWTHIFLVFTLSEVTFVMSSWHLSVSYRITTHY